ncbi:glycerophosphodiester phosphodiesterase [Romboutsia sp. 1001713B170207_170306_H8]|uniref:glycerophosphodiester phosphodiesterase n=1 Tax=Romboutsia sp. 1001713B170207_170306_H8 TaxID=2787112 RepID=UPI0018982474|nr:glycerophosphodiester phosphodiesterase [Romboutsia sp. 1001713B170207_170306_H8]
MIIFAHRGYRGRYPENTILSFQEALKLSIYGIELDVHKSKDGKLVVIHDEDVKRTFKGKGLIKDYNLEDLKSFKCKQLKYRNNELCKVPTLEEVFELIKNTNCILNIEAKTNVFNYHLEEDVLKLIQEYNLENRVLISSFNHKCIKDFQNLNSKIKYGALYLNKKDYYPENNVADHAKKLNVYSIHISRKLASKEIVELAHKNNLKVFVYTINFPCLMKKMIKLNVDGIFTNYPILMKKVLDKNKVDNINN